MTHAQSKQISKQQKPKVVGQYQSHPISEATDSKYKNMSRAVLICGATGKQGGSVINSLIGQNADFEILAITRDAASPSAQRLLQKSPKIKLVQGNLANPDEVFRAAEATTKLPIWGVFSVQVRP
jgi:hypothetical protein